MEVFSPDRSDGSIAKVHDVLWRPGSTAYPCSPTRKLMDRMRCKQDLQKLYEDTPDSSYDLSLKDIVDPCYSISGNLKAIVAETDVKSNAQDAGKSRSRKSSSIPKLTFSFSFPGLRVNSRRSLFAWKASPSRDGRDEEASASKRPVSANLSPSENSHHKRSNPEGGASSMSRIHPSNQCSTCSTYTIFFKCRCLVCGRLYCSICAKECMDSLSEGQKCKDDCKNGPFRKRLSRKIGRRFWPFCSNFELQRLPTDS